MNQIPFLVGFACALGVGLLVNVSLQVLFEIGKKLTRKIRRPRSRLAALGWAVQSSAVVLSEEELLGLSSIPWMQLYLAATLLSLILFGVVGPSLAGSAAYLLLVLPGLVWLFKRYLIRQRRRFLVGQVRQLLIDIRLHMSLTGSLLLGLEQIAQGNSASNVVYRALQRRMLGGSAKSGLDVLQQLANDLNSAHLLRVVQRVQAAQQSGGVLGVDQAIANEIDSLNEEITSQSEEEMQHLPLRITLLAMPFLLGPIVILLFYPLVDRILKTLAGTAIGSGF